MFTFPKIHHFPPFYTQQQNATVLENQLNEWCSLLLSYCQHYLVYVLLPQGAIMAQGSEETAPPLFENKALDRSAPPHFRRAIVSHLIHKLGRGVYVDPKHPDAGVLVFWRTPDEWARMLCDAADRMGHVGSVLTVYELILLDDAADDSFRNLDYHMLARAVDVLVKQGRAQVFRSDDGRIEGIKIV
ncbi:ESCRT-II complex, vps25 subunit [Metschnikowia bicuspidata]|uniref:ESCRT-II complex, vps25 subunit n=1 Tax=Metschnikowia bicuspidata TaxID=27322 RepID=A0A4P9Z7T9_9ASCO|nr:ESCRT-II complex, vps25 subunit [Metschnikowia bicuspidata]